MKKGSLNMTQPVRTQTCATRVRAFAARCWRVGFPRDSVFGYVLLIPMLVVLVGLVAFPFGYAFWMSLHDKIIGFTKVPFIGLQNYAAILGSRDYWHALGISVTYTIPVVGAKLVLGLGIAQLLNQPLPFRSIARGLVMLPWACPILVVAATWQFLLNDVNGVFNWMLRSLGIIGGPVGWLARPETALPTIMVVSIWRGVPFFAVTLLAGLQSVPLELYDAGKVDGASALQRFLHITIPHVRPVMLVVALLTSIWTFNEFSLVWTLTRGGPADYTTVLPILTYQTAIVGGELGRGIAIAVTSVPVLLVLVSLLTRAMAKEEERA